MVFQEIVFRVSFPLPELSNFDRAMYTSIDPSQVNGFVRNRSFYWESSVDTNYQYVHRYNKYGFRDSDWKVSKTSDTKRVIFIGDSYVESVMCDTTMTEYFSKVIPSRNIEVMNAGMLGTGLTRYLRLLTDIAPVFRPDVVVICIYANDFKYKQVDIPTHYLTPKRYDTTVPRILELYQQWKRGAPVPFVLNTFPKRLLPKVGEARFAWNGVLEQMMEHAEPNIVAVMNDGTFHHHRINELSREETYLKEKRNLLVPMDYVKYYSEKFHFRPVVVYIPSRNQVTDSYLQYEYDLCNSCTSVKTLTGSEYNQNQKLLMEACYRVGIPFLDLSHYLGVQESMGNRLYWNYDGHLNEKGTRLVAEKIYRWEGFPKFTE